MEVLLAFGTLFSIVNPFSTSFVFTSIAGKRSRAEKAHIALIAALVSTVVLLVFLYFGNLLLGFFGITIYAFRVAGGLYLGKIGFEMLDEKLRHQPEQYHAPKDEIAIIPLAIPLLSGPGAMTSVLVMTDSTPATAIAIAVLAVGLLSWIVLRSADRISRALGKIGTNVVERVLGLIVLVIAVQFLFNGIAGFLAVVG